MFGNYFVQEINKIDAYKPTKADPQLIVERYKSRFLVIDIAASHLPFSVAICQFSECTFSDLQGRN